jgi:hypothetical protein
MHDMREQFADVRRDDPKLAPFFKLLNIPTKKHIKKLDNYEDSLADKEHIMLITGMEPVVVVVEPVKPVELHKGQLVDLVETATNGSVIIQYTLVVEVDLPLVEVYVLVEVVVEVWETNAVLPIREEEVEEEGPEVELESLKSGIFGILLKASVVRV